MLALFPGLPRFLFFGLRSLYTEVEEHKKTGKAWEHLSRGGHKVDVGGEGPTFK